MERTRTDRATSTASSPGLDSGTMEAIDSLAAGGIDLGEGRLRAASDPFWARLRDLGTELWLDTGDIEGAERLWRAEFSALTTNNTLLNLAGLASFAADQKALDDRIRRLVG